MNEPGRRHGGGGRRRGHGACGAGPERRRRIERGLLCRPRPHAPRPSSRRRLPRRPVLAAAGRGGAPLLEGSAAVGRRRGGRPRGSASPRAARVRVGRSGRPRPAVEGHSTPRGGLGPRAAERPTGVRVRVSPSRISHDRKLEAVSRKRAFTIGLPCVVPGGRLGARNREPGAGRHAVFLLQPPSWAGDVPTPPAANRCKPLRGSCGRTSRERRAFAWGRACCTRSPAADLLRCTPYAPPRSPGQVGVTKYAQNTPKRKKVIASTCQNYRELFTPCEGCLFPIFSIC